MPPADTSNAPGTANRGTSPRAPLPPPPPPFKNWHDAWRDGMAVSLAAIYARRSKGDDGKIEHQIEYLVREAANRGFFVPDTPEFRYADDNVKGPTTSRAGLDRLKRAIDTDDFRFTAVFVKDKTRLGRFKDEREFTVLEKKFEDAGAPMWYCSRGAPPIDRTTMKASEIVMHSVMDVFENAKAAAELEDISNRFTDGMRSAILNGDYPGPVPYGTERIRVNRSTGEVMKVALTGSVQLSGWAPALMWAEDGSADVVKEIFAWAEAGKSENWIARTLNTRREPSPHTRKGYKLRKGWHDVLRWNHAVVRYILDNPIYGGNLLWGRTRPRGEPVHHARARASERSPIDYPQFMTPLIDPRQWNAVAARRVQLRERHRGGRASKPHYLLSGNLFCATCGYRLYGNQIRRKNLPPTLYYRHQIIPAVDHNHKGFVPCVHKSRHLGTAQIEPAVKAAVRQMLSGETLTSIAAQEFAALRAADAALAAPTEKRLSRLERKLKEEQARLECFVDALGETKQAGARARLKEKTDMAAAKVTGLEEEIEAERRKRTDVDALTRRIAAAPSLAPNAAALFDQADAPMQKRIVAALVERVIYDVTTSTLRIRFRVPPSLPTALLSSDFADAGAGDPDSTMKGNPAVEDAA